MYQILEYTHGQLVLVKGVLREKIIMLMRCKNVTETCITYTIVSLMAKETSMQRYSAFKIPWKCFLVTDSSQSITDKGLHQHNHPSQID